MSPESIQYNLTLFIYLNIFNSFLYKKKWMNGLCIEKFSVILTTGSRMEKTPQ